MQWGNVIGYEGKYEVSDSGRVRSLICGGRWGQRTRSSPFYMKPKIIRGGYLYVGLRFPGEKQVWKHVGVLVLESFRGLAPKGTECSHLNGDPRDNRILNLVWETRSQNAIRRQEHGTQYAPKGELSATAKLTESEVEEIRVLGRSGLVSQARIGDRYGVSQTQVGRIIRGERWAHSQR